MAVKSVLIFIFWAPTNEKVLRSLICSIVGSYNRLQTVSGLFKEKTSVFNTNMRLLLKIHVKNLCGTPSTAGHTWDSCGNCLPEEDLLLCGTNAQSVNYIVCFRTKGKSYLGNIFVKQNSYWVSLLYCMGATYFKENLSIKNATYILDLLKNVPCIVQGFTVVFFLK